MWPTALMPERERRWPAQVSVMLTTATVMGPSAPTVFSFLHAQTAQHSDSPQLPACAGTPAPRWSAASCLRRHLSA